MGNQNEKSTTPAKSSSSRTSNPGIPNPSVDKTPSVGGIHSSIRQPPSNPNIVRAAASNVIYPNVQSVNTGSANRSANKVNRPIPSAPPLLLTQSQASGFQTHQNLQTANSQSRKSNLIVVTPLNKPLSTAGTQCNISQSLKQKLQLNSNSKPSATLKQSSTISQPGTGTIPKHASQPRQDTQNSVPVVNHNVIKHAKVQPISSTSTVTSNVSHNNQSASSQGAIKKQTGSQYKAGPSTSRNAGSNNTPPTNEILSTAPVFPGFHPPQQNAYINHGNMPNAIYPNLQSMNPGNIYVPLNQFDRPAAGSVYVAPLPHNQATGAQHQCAEAKGQHNFGGINNITQRNFDQEHQMNSNLFPNGNRNQLQNNNYSGTNVKPEYSRRNRHNRRNAIPNRNYNTIQHPHVQSNVFNTNNSRNVNSNQQTPANRGENNGQNGPKNRGRNRNNNDMAGARERINLPENRQQYADKNGGRRGRSIHFKYLEDLLKLDEEDFVLAISGNMHGLNDFVEKIDLTDDTYVVIIRILKKILDSRFPESQQILAQTILRERFVNNLQKYLVSLPMYDAEQKRMNKFFWQNADEFLSILIEVSRKILEMLPNYASAILPKVVLALQVCIPTFEQYQNQHVSDEIKEKLDELTRSVQAAQLRFEEEGAVTSDHNKSRKKFRFEGQEPPDDFRTISVYPDVTEILSGRSFVRPNIIDGPYKNVDHYLDVQFRLLREDFVNPLRCGVRSIQCCENKRHENVRVHEKIRFLYQETLNEYHCVRLNFNFTRKPFNFSNENSKKFMFGTLLCFTCDNFATMKFARVIKRDIEDLKKGELVVGFDTPEPDLIFNHDYLMIECSVYFEPYFHVLTALKNIHEKDFAMKQYIVDVQPVNVLPTYLKSNMVYTIDKRGFYIHDLKKSANNLYGFNDSQMNAFKAALTNEFAIIQGPPGTGKTFLGLKIAKALIDNYLSWWESTPMLVICFTNHALDQFLEGLLSTTTEVVRIGGQCKNETLKMFNLGDLRKKAYDKKSNMSKNQVHNTLRALGSVTASIKDIEQYNGIVSWSRLCNNVPGLEETFFNTEDPKCFTDWLLEGYKEQSVKGGDNKMSAYVVKTEDQENQRKPEDDPGTIFFDDDANANISYQSSAETLFENMDFSTSTSSFKLEDMEKKIRTLKSELDLMENNQEMPIDDVLTVKYNLLRIDDKKRILLESEEQYQYLKRKFEEVKNAIQKQEIQQSDIHIRNPKLVCYNDRWALYTFWLNSYKQHLQQRAAVLTQEFQGLFKQYEEIQNLEDTRLLRQKLVVGMTTTSAARLRSVLEGLGSPIVIVEEAAEVLEAHIVTALTKHCRHLILIGDHKQLKPSSADYQITKDYNLGVSLFERMVNNGVQCHTLNVQHRMRPEISRLICPIIYPDLKNHESVFNRPPIAGIDSCIRFINHTHLEDACGDNPTKKNLYEVKFAVALARHLILNGYKSEQVTILAAYLGQMFEMLKERERYGSIIKNVRIVALDNYQGEENDIIILSLVRSNKENRIGFLATENRVCVALSRAKYGFYIIGNMGLLSRESKLWDEIRKVLESQNAIGPDLILRCEIHTETITRVNKVTDFERVSEGGCSQICGAELICGHLCRSLCHIQNRDHKNYQCLERCNKELCDENKNHICRKMCYEKCGPCTYKVMRKKDCGHELSLDCYVNPNIIKCPVLVKTKLPCDHMVDKPCHISADIFVCRMSCEIIVDPCGHSCTRNCHIRNDPDHIEYKCMKKCARPRVGCTMPTDSTKHLCPKFCYESCAPCDIHIRKQRTKCPHMDVVACSEDVDSIECKKPCTRRLSCGHECKKQCYEPCSTFSCLFKVEKVLDVCGHKMVTECNQQPNRNRCDKKCPLKLPCGHSCTKRCNQVCTPRCEVLVDCRIVAMCGHVIVRIKCHDLTFGLAKTDRKLLMNCSQPCNAELKCGHKCSGTCGECLQGRFHKRCSEKCGVPLVCNHECGFPCREACRPCEKPCTYRCVHSVCKKKCGEVCIPCKEPCQRRCEHQKCSRPCSSICDVQPCTQPCPKLLHCGHPCIGFCGEPCPLKCLTCDRQELLETEMLFGYEDDNSRFVFLLDCKHVIENDGMEQWLTIGDNLSAIGVKVCPKCKTPIKTTLRYSDHIKLAIADVNKVKIKAVGTIGEIDTTRHNLMGRIKILQDRLKSSIWESYLQKIENRLKPVRKKLRQNIDKIQLTAITSKLQVLEQIIDICKNQEELNLCQQYQQEIHDVLTRDINYTTNQEIEDVMVELGRLLRAIQYERMKRHPQFAYSLTQANTKLLTENIQMSLCSLGPYLNDANLKSWLEKLQKILGTQQGLTDVERKNIIKVMGMGRGHWYKCPNGHVYAIGECGRAMEVSKCIECGAQIGGRHHSLLNTNDVASEIGVERYPVYLGMANNMENFMNLR